MGIRSIRLNSTSELGFTAEIYSTVLNYYYKSIPLVFSCPRRKRWRGCRNNESKSMAMANKARPVEHTAQVKPKKKKQ